MANYSCIAENIAGKRESDVAVLSVYGTFTQFQPKLKIYIIRVFVIEITFT